MSSATKDEAHHVLTPSFVEKEAAKFSTAWVVLHSDKLDYSISKIQAKYLIRLHEDYILIHGELVSALVQLRRHEKRQWRLDFGLAIVYLIGAGAFLFSGLFL